MSSDLTQPGVHMQMNILSSFAGFFFLNLLEAVCCYCVAMICLFSQLHANMVSAKTVPAFH